MKNIYMVEFDVPYPMSPEFASLIPAQRSRADKLMADQKILSYSLSMDRRKLWVIFSAETDSELFQLITDLPLTPYMHYEYEELMFHNAPWMLLPAPSMN